MTKVIHKAASRGATEHGWLSSRHTFSFGSYYDSKRMGFGLLRVINDDVVQPAQGFGTHPHENMEIVSIPLRGELLHKDSMGHKQHIKTGEVQILSAGTGLTHSEFNASNVEPVNFLQIWVLPKEQNIEPRYDQKNFAVSERNNRWQNVVTPSAEDEGVRINQDAWFWLGDFQANSPGSYTLQRHGHGIYLFVIDGRISVVGEQLNARDGLGLTAVEKIEFVPGTDARLLTMEVPL